VLAELQIRELDARRAGAGIIVPENPRTTIEARPIYASQKALAPSLNERRPKSSEIFR
jgi:hypothetical protein